MTEEQRITIERYVEAIESYGYCVSSEPIEGAEDTYIDHLRGAFRKIEAGSVIMSSKYRYRDGSKNMRRALAVYLPHPGFGIEVRP